MSTGKPSDADTVYGRFLCRGDVTKDVCVECVKNASVRIKILCPTAKESILWFDKCMLQYSDHNFLSTMDEEALLIGYNPENEEAPTEFRKLLNKTMDHLITQATERPERYASKEANFKKSRGTTLHTFAQCWPDIPVAHCKYCLQNVTSIRLRNQTGKIGGGVLHPSCFVRFECYAFYKVEKKWLSTSRLVVVITSATSVVVLLCDVLWFTLKRERNKRNDFEEDPNVESEISELHSLQFDVGTIEAATGYFSNHNKLWEGGFGPVYKGILPSGKTIAAKRLSQSSKQGVEEFTSTSNEGRE